MTVFATHDSMPIVIQRSYFLACMKFSRSSSVIPGGSGSLPAGNTGATRGRFMVPSREYETARKRAKRHSHRSELCSRCVPSACGNIGCTRYIIMSDLPHMVNIHSSPLQVLPQPPCFLLDNNGYPRATLLYAPQTMMLPLPDCLLSVKVISETRS